MSNKINISFQGVVTNDEEKNQCFVTLIIDTTINGTTTKRKHIFDNQFKVLDNKFKQKVIDIIFEDVIIKNDQ